MCFQILPYYNIKGHWRLKILIEKISKWISKVLMEKNGYSWSMLHAMTVKDLKESGTK